MSEQLDGVGFTNTGDGTVVVAEFGEAGAWLEIEQTAMVRRPDWSPVAEVGADE